MKSIKDEMKELMKDHPITEISTYICKGCGENVSVKEITIFGGARKGEKVKRESGCKCFEIEEARQAYEDHKRFLSGKKPPRD